MTTYAGRACPLFGEGAERARYSSGNHDGCVWRQLSVDDAPAALIDAADMAIIGLSNPRCWPQPGIVLSWLAAVPVPTTPLHLTAALIS